ncbi:hypothetical protein NGM37_02070, partial [Streptomyces sp. TRM76130]|nr:hypothetical protein [Streptomyces sp. TRM76130]
MTSEGTTAGGTSRPGNTTSPPQNEADDARDLDTTEQHSSPDSPDGNVTTTPDGTPDGVDTAPAPQAPPTTSTAGDAPTPV